MASLNVQTVNASTLYNDALPHEPVLGTHTTSATGLDTKHTEEYVKTTPRAVLDTEVTMMKQNGTNVYAPPFVSTQTYHSGNSSTSTHLAHTPTSSLSTHTHTTTLPAAASTTITETKHTTPIVMESENSVTTTHPVATTHLPLPVHHEHHTPENHTLTTEATTHPHLAHTLPFLSQHTEAHKHAVENRTFGHQTDAAGHHTESTQRQPDVVIGMQEELVGGLKKLAGKILGSESLEMRGRTQIAKGKEEIVAAKAEKENYSPRFAKDSVVGGKESVSRDNNGLVDGNKSVSREYEERNMRAGTEPSANSLARHPLTPRQNHTEYSAEEVARGNIVTDANTLQTARV